MSARFSPRNARNISLLFSWGFARRLRIGMFLSLVIGAFATEAGKRRKLKTRKPVPKGKGKTAADFREKGRHVKGKGKYTDAKGGPKSGKGKYADYRNKGKGW